jgi:metal-responsive CopG/Arc/MetJ family transcriptional regulator
MARGKPMAKRTYVLPPEALEEFEKTVHSGERSAVIAQLLADWLAERRREQLRQDIIAGCREMANIYREIEGEYHPLEEEAHHALEKSSPARSGRARASRSR